MIWNPYNIYRAWKSGVRPFIVSRGFHFRIHWMRPDITPKQFRKKFRPGRNGQFEYKRWFDKFNK